MNESISRILVPVDFSAHSDRALRYAANLAAQVGASVEVLHVVENLYPSVAFSEIYVPDMSDVMQAMINEAARQLALIKAGMFPDGADVETSVVVGRPECAIVDRAKAGSFDLIVMGTHGRTGLSHMFMGSVAERVVRTSPCPVLTLHASIAAETSAQARPPKAA